MARNSRESFEVQVMRQGRWVTESARGSEEEAKQLANQFLSNKACAGARVVRNYHQRDGSMVETVVFQKTQAVKDAPVRINPIENAAARCEKVRDYFSLESRMTINRVLRAYLESVTVTPTELLHSRKELQRLADKDNLLSSAIDAVASLQVKDTEMTAKARRDEMFAAFSQIQTRVRKAESLNLPKIGKRFSDAIADMDGMGGESPEYLAMVALSRELVGTRNWLGKLDRLLKLLAEENDKQAALLLDTVIADLLGANVVQEVLGWQPSLGSAIIAMLDLADGKFDFNQSDAKDVAELLNAQLAANRLPGARHCLIDRALKQLRSPSPLSRNNPAKELEEYQKVLARLLMPGGLLSGPEAAEALTLRGTRFVEAGGATGRRAAITATVQVMPDRAHGVMYLAELSRTELAKEHLDDIVEALDGVFSARVIDELTRRSLSPKERMLSATGAFKAAASSALPDDIKAQVTQHIDGVLERYLIDESIIDKLDDPNTILRDRAVRLVKFCAAGVLPEGKALTRARGRIVQLLRQPNFDAHFVEGITDPAKAEKALRDFHQLLVLAGFGK